MRANNNNNSNNNNNNGESSNGNGHTTDPTAANHEHDQHQNHQRHQSLVAFGDPASPPTVPLRLLGHEQHAQLAREHHRISYCMAQQQSFGRVVDVINISPLKGLTSLYKIPFSLLKLPSDMRKTAAEQAEEAALDAACHGEEQKQQMSMEQTRELASEIASL